jgi:enoyl-CoA hydratase/carnithine racemase
VVRANGKHFSAGIDLEMLAKIATLSEAYDCEGRTREALHQYILDLQRTFNAIEACPVPVIAQVQGACLGAGVDLIAACDLRYCASQAYFSVKEVDLGVTADMGSLQRLYHIIGFGPLQEMAYTARNVPAEEAERMGLVNRRFEDNEALDRAVIETAETIAAKSPLTIRGIKRNLLHAREHSVAEGLAFVADYNAATLISKDAREAVTAGLERRPAHFDN